MAFWECGTKYNISACFHIGNCSLAWAAVTFIIIRAVLRGANSFLGWCVSTLEVAGSSRRPYHFHSSGSSQRRHFAVGYERLRIGNCSLAQAVVTFPLFGQFSNALSRCTIGALPHWILSENSIFWCQVVIHSIKSVLTAQSRTS